MKIQNSVQEYNPTHNSSDKLSLSSAAMNHVKKYKNKHPDAKGLRLTIEKMGCSGYAYVVEFVKVINPQDKVFNLDTDINLYVDSHYFDKLKGTQIDYVRQGLNERFIFKNPNEKGTCGCGESVSI